VANTAVQTLDVLFGSRNRTSTAENPTITESPLVETSRQEFEQQSRFAAVRDDYNQWTAQRRAQGTETGSILESVPRLSLGEFLTGVSGETATVLVVELSHQAANGQPFSVRDAARSGISTAIEQAFDNTVTAVLKQGIDSLYDGIVSAQPPDRQTLLRAYQLPLAWMTLNAEKILSTYDDFIEKEIAAPIRSFSADSSRPSPP